MSIVISSHIQKSLVKPFVQLTGTDGNAYSIIGNCERALKHEGNSKEVIDAFRTEAMSGDYDHVLQTAMTYCEVA